MTTIDEANCQYDQGRLSLIGKWQDNQVAQAWQQVTTWQQVSHIDLSAITLIDSALIALLVKIQAQAGQPLSVSGMSDFVRSLLGLYELQEQFVEVVG